MKLYIAGPMSGLPDYNYPAFHEAEAMLKRVMPTYLCHGEDLTIENPANNPPPSYEPQWEDWMRQSLTQMLTCDRVIVLDGWEKSRGARLEVYLARELGIITEPMSRHVKDAL